MSGFFLNPNECGLVLEGGSLRGNYTVGVLETFMENDIHFPYVIGVSSGALSGISYISGQRERNVQLLYRYHDDPRYVSLRNLLTTRSVIGKDFLFNKVPNELLPFDYDNYLKSDKRHVMVCTNIRCGKPEYFEKKPDLLKKDFLKILEASSSMPYSSNCVKYNKQKYLDGAISDPIPLKKAQSDGFKKSVIVLTNPAGFRKKEDFHPPNILLYPFRKNLRCALRNRVKNYNEELDYAEEEEKAGNAIIIRPSIDLKVARLERNKEKLIRLYELGISDTKEFLKKHNLLKI